MSKNISASEEATDTDTTNGVVTDVPPAEDKVASNPEPAAFKSYLVSVPLDKPPSYVVLGSILSSVHMRPMLSGYT